MPQFLQPITHFHNCFIYSFLLNVNVFFGHLFCSLSVLYFTQVRGRMQYMYYQNHICDVYRPWTSTISWILDKCNLIYFLQYIVLACKRLFMQSYKNQKYVQFYNYIFSNTYTQGIKSLFSIICLMAFKSDISELKYFEPYSKNRYT